MVIYYFLFHKDKFVSFTPDYCNIFSSIKNKDRERERVYRIQTQISHSRELLVICQKVVSLVESNIVKDVAKFCVYSIS